MTNEEQIKKWKKQLEEYDKQRIAELNEIRNTPSVPISSRNKDADNGNFFGGLLGGLLPGSSIADVAIKNIRADQTLQQEAKKQGIDLNNLYTTQENLNMFGADAGRVVESTGAGLSRTLSDLGKGTLIGARNMGVLNSVVDKAITDLRAGTENAQIEKLKSKAKEKGIDTVTLDEYLDKAKNTKTSLELINDFSANTFDKWTNEANQRIVELQNETDNPFTKAVIGFVPNLSQQAVTIGASLINPVLGTSVATGQAMGSYYNDAKSRGMTDEQANDFSQIMGIVEGATEMIGIDKLVKAGKGAKALAKGGLSSARKELSKEVITSTFGNLLSGSMDNFIQEAITEPIQEGVADWIGGKGNWENIDQRMLEAGINGAITSLITGGANIGVQSAVGVASKTRNGQTATQQEVNQGLVDTLAEIDKLSKEEKQEFIDKYVTPGIETAQDVVKNEQNQVPIEPNRAVPMQTSENAQQQVQEQEQQVISNQNENALNQNVEPQNLVESAERSGIDVKDEKTRKNLETIQKFNENRGVKATFDADAFKGHNNVNSFFRTDENGNREIVFNPNTMTDKTIQQLAVHEVYHDMVAGGTAQELTDFVVQKMSNNPEYQEYVRALQDVYEEQDSDIIKEEAVAHYLEKNLGTDEFISELQQRGDRTTIQKIIDTIKDMITKAKNTLTGKGDLNYLLDLQRKYEQAYRGEFKGSQEQTKLSKQVDGNETEPIKVQYKGEEREYKNYYDYMKDISENEEQLANNLLFKHNSYDFEIPTSKNETSFYHGTDYGGYYKDLNLQDYGYGMDRNYGDYFYVTSDKTQTTPYGKQIAQFIIPNDKILSLEEYRKMGNVSDEELFNKYLAIEMPDNEYIIKDIDKVKEYTLDKAKEYIKNKDQQTQPTTDNQGRTLTKEQQDYFKDSKVRDEDGKLIEVYHGTPNGGFTIFDKNKIDKNSITHQWGYGFYFSNDSKVGDEYTRNYNRVTEKYDASPNPQKYTSYLNIEKPFVISDTISSEEGHNLNRNKIKELIMNGDRDWFFDSWIPTSTKTINELNYKLDGLTKEQIENLSKEEKVDYWLRQEYDERGDKNILQEMSKAYNKTTDLIDNFQKILGYDGIIVKGQNDTNQYIVFNSNQIKNVDNTNPTESPDIRYSKEAPTKDNQGRELSKGQQEYFRDSKIRDENGELLTVYHGTNSDFTIFDRTKGGQSNTGASVGFWFTETKEGAENFANDVWYGDNKPNAKEVYLNIKKPKIYENVENETQKQAYRQEYENLEKEARDLRKEYSWEKTDYKTTMTFDTLIRDYQTAERTNEKVDLDSFRGLAKERGFSNEQISNMERDAKKYTELIKKSKEAENNYDKLRYSDAYEQFKIDLYEMAGQSAEDANTGGLGMSLNNPKETVEKYRNKLIEDGYDGIVIKNTRYDNSNFAGENNQYVAFYPEQIKNVDNTNPTKNVDIRYQQQGAGTSQQIIDNFLESTKVNEGTGTAIKDLARVQEETTEPVRQVAPNEAPAQVPQVNEVKQRQVENTQPTTQETITQQTEPVVSGEKGQRKTLGKEAQNQNLPQEFRDVADKLYKTNLYTKKKNSQLKTQAQDRISKVGADNLLTDLTEKTNNSPRLSAEDMVASIELYNHYVQKGDIQKSETALQNIAMSGTEIAQALQAMSIMNHMTPQGQAIWIQRSADKLNKSMLAKKKATLKTIDGQQRVIDKNGKDITNKTPLFKFTQEMQQKLLNSTKDNMYDVIDDIYKEMGQQVPKSHMEQFDEWRFFSMLGNPKTHIRNSTGNVTMEGLRQVKNKLAGAIEDAYYSVTGKDGERNHTLRFADKKTKEFAKQDVKNRDVQTMLGVTEDKYNPQSRLKQNQRTFKSNLFENSVGKLFKGNTGLLSKEDVNLFGIAGLEPAYRRSLTEYITANRLDVDTMTDKQLQRAREYAVTEAKEATFHTHNKIASMLNTLENKNLATKILVGGTVPFKQTPMNVAIQGFEYSPAGLLKTLTYDTVQLKNGNINANQYINKISKGLTGTGIALLGYALTSAGVLKASSGGDDKDDYEKSLGKQNYAIQIGDNTYSLDWLAPAGIPLFVGSELYQISKADAEEKKGGNVNQNEIAQSAENLFNAMTTAMNPMTEMTMLSGLTSVLKSYANDPAQALGNILINTGKSYVTQSVPTALGQIARSTDDKERSTSSTESNVFTKAIDSTKNQIMSKVPGLRQMLPVATDVWGNEVEGKNYLENAILPANRKEVKSDKVDEAITKLYDETGESAVIPDTYIQKTLTLDKEKYRLTNEEYAQLKQQYGQSSHDLLEALTQSSDYDKLTNEQKVKAVKEVYSYVKASLKHTYADQNDIDAEDSKVYQKVQDVIRNGGDAKDYFKYVGLTNGMDKDAEKINALENSNIRNKGAIYESTVGKDDDDYKIMKNAGVNDKAYLDYKQQKFESDKDAYGKTISGSKQDKFYDYMDNANMTYEQKLLLTGMNYALLPGERDTLANYIDTLPISASEKTDIYRHLKGAKVYDNGEIYY